MARNHKLMGDPTLFQRVLQYVYGIWAKYLLPTEVQRNAFFLCIKQKNPDEAIGHLTVMDVMERWG